jgi:predicted AlkP superfamily phosphohydrolase/phosphomutase
MERVIEDQYRRCDEILGRVYPRIDARTLLVVMSDHGCTSFQRGFHVNTWLHDRGFLALKDGFRPGAAGEMLSNVDWTRTRAYALGLGSVYLNLAGREAHGIVQPSEAAAVATQIVEGLTGLVDDARGEVAIRSVARRDEIYSGPFVDEAPDLVIRFAPGWRVSWATGLGGIPEGHFEDNVKRWSGDHITDPAAVPGVLLMNRPFVESSPHLVDLAPTILAALGVPKGAAMEGSALFR